MKFKKDNETDDRELKINDRDGDELSITSWVGEKRSFALIIGVKPKYYDCPYVMGLSKREARSLAKAILKELDRK